MIDGRADLSCGSVHQSEAHVAAGIFDAVEVPRDAAARRKNHHAAGVSEEIGLGIEGKTKVRGPGRGFNGFLRAGEEMPAGIRLRTAEMNQRLLFLLHSHFRRLAGIEADENYFVVAPGIEREHAQHADDALLDLIAKHGASVIDEGEDHRLLPEILAELNAAAGFVAEREVQRHWPVERRLESYVLQSRRHGRSRWADVARNRLRAQRARRQQKRRKSTDMAKFIHFVLSFSPPPAQAPRANLFRPRSSSRP